MAEKRGGACLLVRREERQLSNFTSLFAPILQEHNVQAYLSGHDHTMQHHLCNGVNYFVAGTGSKIVSHTLDLLLLVHRDA